MEDRLTRGINPATILVSVAAISIALWLILFWFLLSWVVPGWHGGLGSALGDLERA